MHSSANLVQRLFALLLALSILTDTHFVWGDELVKPGDVVLATQQAAVMAEEKAVARARPGEELTVRDVQRSWALVEVDRNGKKLLGWVNTAQLQRKAAIDRDLLTRGFLFEPPQGKEEEPPFPRRWSDSDKQQVLAALRKLQDAAPGILERMTAYRPVKMYRIVESKGKEWVVAYVPQGSHSVYFTDNAFDNKGGRELSLVLAHEFTHIIDLGFHLSGSEGWANAIGPRIRKVHQALADAGMTTPNDGQTREEAFEVQRRFDPVARQAGLPEVYATTNEAEALATCLHHYYEGEEVPDDIGTYLEKSLLSLPYRAESQVETIHRALQAKPEEAIGLLTSVIEQGNELRGYAYWNRGVMQYRARNYSAALDDFDKALALYQHSPRSLILIHGDRANTYLGLRDGEKAIAAMTAAVELAPRNPELYLRRANLRPFFSEQRLGDYDRAIELAPSYYTALSDRASLRKYLKQYDLAEADYARMIAMKPDLYFTYINRGETRFSLEKYEEALADFDKGLEMYVTQYGAGKPLHPSGYVGRARTKIKLKDWQGAVDDCTAFMKSWPTRWPDFNAIRADAYLGLEDYEKAVADYLVFTSAFGAGRVAEVAPRFEQALAHLEPKGPADFQQRGTSWQMLGKHQQAADDFSKAIELGQNDAAVYKLRGQSLLQLGKQQDASADFDAAIKSTPDDFELYHLSWLCALGAGDSDRAFATLEAGLKRSPMNFYLTILNADRAFTHYRAKNYTAAIEECTKIAETAPKYDRAYFIRGMAKRDSKDPDGAIEDFGKVLEISRQNAEALSLRGDLYFFSKKQYEQALQDYDVLVTLQPNNAAAHNMRGRSLRMLDRPGEAIPAFTRAIELSPKFTSPLLNRALANSSSGEYAKARQDLDTLLSIKSDDAFALNSRAWLLATAPDDDVRDGKLAVADATKSCELREWKSANSVGTLAAAYAETGDFEKAVEFEQKALDLGKETEGYDIEAAEARLQLYRDGKPYRQTPVRSDSSDGGEKTSAGTK